MPSEPGRDCQLCPRLVAWRQRNQLEFPLWHNAPVATFSSNVPNRDNTAGDVLLLIVGLAPGLRGANRTGRPFTGDYAGGILYRALFECGFATGDYDENGHDELVMVKTAITNAVRCVPPANKPTGEEAKNCRPHLTATINRYDRLRVLLALGHISHNNTLAALGEKASKYKFGHGVCHQLANRQLLLFDSYHPSRYNLNTGRLTFEQFKQVVSSIANLLEI